MDISYHHLRLPRKRFEISTGVRESAEVFIVEVTHGSFRGIGSGTPATSYGDSVKKCEKALAKAGNYAVDPDTYFEDEMSEEIREISPSAAAAIDIAFWDIRAKMDGLSVAAALGGSLRGIPTDRTIDLMKPADAGREAASLVGEGFKSIKVKVGVSLADDIERIRAVRNAAGSGARIFIDANGGYDVENAAKLWDKVADLEIDFFEQPVPQDMLEGLASLRARGIKVCADESFIDEETLDRIIEMDAADMINIKLMKCGGITTAIRLSDIAGNAGLGAMVGCMGDIGISITAAAHLVCSIDPHQADLDSHLSIEPICDGPAVIRGDLSLRDKPGIGVGLIEGWQRWRA